MRALRASMGYAGCTLRIRLPSFMFEMRSGATVVAGRTAGKMERDPPANRLATSFASPLPVPTMAGPAFPTCGGASSTLDGIPFGICDGVLNLMSVGVIGAVLIETMRLAGGEGSARVGPRLTGVER